MELLRTNLRSIIIALLLILGVVATVYLAGQRQILKSKATSDVSTLIEISDDSGKQLEPTDENSFKTNSRNLRIKVKDLLPEEQIPQ